MSDERKPVMCPWCKLSGCNVVMAKQRESVGMTTGEDYYFCPECHSHSPHIATSDGNWDKASNDCYLAATRTPPNKPMTFDGMVALDEADAVWVVSKDGAVCVVNGLDALEYAGYEYDALYFARKPTPEDIEAARKKNNHD